MSVLKSVVRGYVAFFRKMLFFVLLVVACLAISAGIVFPLYFLADSMPQLYTTIALFIICVGVLAFAIIKSYRYLNPKDAEKDEVLKRRKTYLIKILRIFVLLLTFGVFVFLVLKGYNLVGLVVLLLGFVLNGILAYGIGTSKKVAKVKDFAEMTTDAATDTVTDEVAGVLNKEV